MSGASECDYLVLGAGASGCVVAGRLSEDPGRRVMLIEAGGGDQNPLLRLPGTGFLISAAPDYNWNFVTEPIDSLEGRRLVWLQGKVLGGSSTINGMVYARGHSREYDLWRQMGCAGWSYEDVLPFFKRLEGDARGESARRGGGGPIRLKKSALGLGVCDAFLEAAKQCGYPVVDDLNDDVVEGFGYYDTNVDRGQRISAAAGYIRPFRRRPNLAVQTHTEVLRLVAEGERIVGAEVLCQGERRIIRAARETILCCGGVKSPQVLMLSGIGPADELGRYSIPVLVDLPGVGRNLQNHPCYRMQYACSAPVTAYGLLRPHLVAKSLLEYALARRGPLAESFISVGGFLRTDPALELPDIQVVMLAALVHRKLGEGRRRLRDLLPQEEGFSLTVYQGTPWSRGEIRLSSADPLAAPRIVPGYFSDPRDMATLRLGLERVREITAAPAMRAVIGREIMPGSGIRTAEALEAEIRHNAATSYHQSGTCAMGTGPDAVVDPELRVRGVRGLRVADASVIPRLPAAALHAVTLMIGEKAADMIIRGVSQR